jgi:hypothetical protein
MHHGQGIFYMYEEDAELIVADLHEHGRYLYPGAGAEEETRKSAATGVKLNIALKSGSGDPEFQEPGRELNGIWAAPSPNSFSFSAAPTGCGTILSPIGNTLWRCTRLRPKASGALRIVTRQEADDLCAGGTTATIWHKSGPACCVNLSPLGPRTVRTMVQ